MATTLTNPAQSGTDEAAPLPITRDTDISDIVDKVYDGERLSADGRRPLVSA